MRELRITNSITNRESPSLQKYLQEIGKVELISGDEEVRLTRLIKKGDKSALQKLIKANLRFVVSVAKQFQHQGISLPDLINEGNIGLITAAQRFDETRGFKFISFAVWWIRQSIIQAIAEQSRMIRVPMNKLMLKNKIRKAQTILENELERSPTDEELSLAIGIDELEIRSSLALSDRHMSLDSTIGEEDEGSFMDMIENTNAEKPDNEVIYKQSLKCDISRSLKFLSENQQKTIAYFFGLAMDEPLSLDEIGIRLSLSSERVRQIKEQGLIKLRAKDSYHLLRVYLGL